MRVAFCATGCRCVECSSNLELIEVSTLREWTRHTMMRNLFVFSIGVTQKAVATAAYEDALGLATSSCGHFVV